MSDDVTWIKLDDRELAAVLAGLQCLAHCIEGSDPKDIDTILTGDGEFDAMALFEVDALREQINFGGDELPTPRVLIECSGGLVQNIISDAPVLVCWPDEDAIDDADKDYEPRSFHPPYDVVMPSIIDERLEDFNKRLAEAQAKVTEE
jgi:hypothetical protein